MGTQITAPHPATQLYWGEMVPFAREGRMVLEFLHESNHAFSIVIPRLHVPTNT
jgi:hypothetical protein